MAVRLIKVIYIYINFIYQYIQDFTPFFFLLGQIIFYTISCGVMSVCLVQNALNQFDFLPREDSHLTTVCT